MKKNLRYHHQLPQKYRSRIQLIKLVMCKLYTF
jgi:hypothetical protein